MSRIYEWNGVITNASLVQIKDKRCVRAKFVTPLEQYKGAPLNVKGQTFNIGPVKRIVKRPAGLTVFTELGRYMVVGDIKGLEKR